MGKILFIFCMVSFVSLQAAVMQEGEFTKEKAELAKLKKDLDAFYKDKDNEYKKQKAELENINKDIQTKLDKIEAAKVENQKILDQIDGKIADKSMQLYAKMKEKLVYQILQEKINNGNINDVFDIIVRLKEKKVMVLMKMFDVKTATELMNRMKDYKSKNNIEGKK
ncbi:MAG: hypothetical protein PHF17_05765 [Arcobacteraceae bacterium]|nr:hypothetical protein [Arcobacteraceae bacterium]